MKKKFLSVALCAALAFTSAISANAAFAPVEYKGFKALSEQIYISDNTVKVFTYNIDETHTNGILYKGGDTQTKYNILFKDCISSPQSMLLPASEKYARYLSSGSGNIYATHSFATTGGRYKKIRIKLSEFNTYFNEDGTHTKSVGIIEPFDYNYKFKYEPMPNGCYYNSCLALISGAAVTAVTPDENGEAEFFVSTDVGSVTEMMTTFSYRTEKSSGGGGGNVGGYISSKLKFGNVDLNHWVDVNDVTFLQLYISGKTELDTLGLFHADVNCDNIYDVKDVTALQFGLIK